MNFLFNYLDGFSWPVPNAFSTSIGKCSFEKGDVFYDNKAAYEMPWLKALELIKHSIQVKEVLGYTIFEDQINQEKQFHWNWEIPIIIILTDHKKRIKQEIKTTQANLYCSLWFGSIEYLLNPKIVPDKPLLMKEIFSKKNLINEIIMRYVNQKYDCIFYFPYDITNNLSINKISIIKSHFNRNKILYNNSSINLYKERIDLNAAPTINISIFEIVGKLDLINQNLKSCLYKPNTEKQIDKHKFNLNRHGILDRIAKKKNNVILKEDELTLF